MSVQRAGARQPNSMLHLSLPRYITTLHYILLHNTTLYSHYPNSMLILSLPTCIADIPVLPQESFLCAERPRDVLCPKQWPHSSVKAGKCPRGHSCRQGCRYSSQLCYCCESVGSSSPKGDKRGTNTEILHCTTYSITPHLTCKAKQHDTILHSTTLD